MVLKRCDAEIGKGVRESVKSVLHDLSKGCQLIIASRQDEKTDNGSTVLLLGYLTVDSHIREVALQ